MSAGMCACVHTFLSESWLGCVCMPAFPVCVFQVPGVLLPPGRGVLLYHLLPPASGADGYEGGDPHMEGPGGCGSGTQQVQGWTAGDDRYRMG